MCKTNPIPGGAGWDGATGTWDAGQSCKTNPIGEEVSSLKCQGSSESCKTNPICGSPRGTGIPSASLSGQALPVSVNHGQDGDPKRDLSRLGTHAHATVLPGETRLGDAGRAVLHKQSQFGEARRASGSRLCKTNPISESWSAGEIPIIPVFHHSNPTPVVQIAYPDICLVASPSIRYNYRWTYPSRAFPDVRGPALWRKEVVWQASLGTHTLLWATRWGSAHSSLAWPRAARERR
jgi:hypothetical protein